MNGTREKVILPFPPGNPLARLISIVTQFRNVVDPLSVTIGIGAAIAALLAAYGLYAAGQRPEYVVDMREVASYYQHKSTNEALNENLDHPKR